MIKCCQLKQSAAEAVAIAFSHSIVGIVIGGGIGVVLIAAILACVCVLRSQRKKDDEKSHPGVAVGLNANQSHPATGIYAGVPPAPFSSANDTSRPGTSIYAHIDQPRGGDHPRYDDVTDVLAR